VIAPSFLIYIKKNDEGLARRPKGKSTKQAQSDACISFAYIHNFLKKMQKKEGKSILSAKNVD